MRAAVVVVLLSLAACAGKGPAAAPPVATRPPEPPAAPATENVSLADIGLDADRLDKGADPCDDFYRFACGGWLDKTEVPPDEALWGTFYEIDRRNEQILHKILDDAAAANGSSDPITAKLGAFHGGCLDEAAIEKEGLSALQPIFAETRKVKDPTSLFAAVAALHKAGLPGLFGVRSRQDKEKATAVIAEMVQGGLGLPDREYYLGNDDRTKALRATYLGHLERMLVLLGRKPAAAKKGAAAVLALETDVARTHKTRVELRDERATYNKVDRAALAKLAAGLPWDAYFKTIGIAGASEINLEAPKAIEALPAIARRHKPAVWRDYLDVHVADAMAAALPKKIDDEAFSFEQALSGQKEQRPRWRRCVYMANESLGELVGQPFVQAAFPGASKTAAQEMVRQIVAAFDENLNGVAWMDDATRAKAREKIAKLDLMIGYPDRWRTYDFEVDRGKFAQSLLAAGRWEKARDLAKIGQPLDRRDWLLPPAIVNAYYTPQLNQIVFPAGVLQRPFYDVKSRPWVNLGAIGMFVGHELTHGFDDQGSLYDGDGNLSGWWPDDVTRTFKERTQCVARYYSGFEVLPGLNLNGELTNGENIADMGGVKLAFHAYRTLRKDAPRRVVADGFTEDQQFFLAMGQAWCEKESEEVVRLLTATNPHSLPKFRVLGALSSLPEFGDAFACKAGARMRPEKICEVW